MMTEDKTLHIEVLGANWYGQTMVLSDNINCGSGIFQTHIDPTNSDEVEEYVMSLPDFGRIVDYQAYAEINQRCTKLVGASDTMSHHETLVITKVYDVHLWENEDNQCAFADAYEGIFEFAE